MQLTLPAPWITDSKPPVGQEVLGICLVVGRWRAVFAVWLGELNGWSVNGRVKQFVAGWCRLPQLPPQEALAPCLPFVRF